MTPSIFVDDSTHSSNPSHGSYSDPSGVIDNRLRRLEEDIHELRDTLSGFAASIAGEVKEIKQTQTSLPFLAPGMVSDLVHSSVTGMTSTTQTQASKRPWLLTEAFRDVWTAIRMYFDPRYRVRRFTQILVPVILVLFVLNYLFWASFPIPFLKTVLEKCFDIVLAIMLYKVWYREVQRYRDVITNVQAWNAYQARMHTAQGGIPAPHDVTDPVVGTRGEEVVVE